MSLHEDAHGITAEVTRIVSSAQQTGWADAPTQSALGAIKDYQQQLDAIIDQLTEPVAPPSPPPPPPPDPPAWRGPAAGFYASQRYGNGGRQWGNLTIPSGAPKGVLVQVHGGGWMQGDPNVALKPGEMRMIEPHEGHEARLGLADFFGLRQMASYAAQRWGVIVWEPAYQYATAANPASPEACLADVRTAIHWLYGKLNEWGALQLPVVYAGHSAGGQLSLRAALDPTIPAPHAWLGMAAAGLTVHSVADVQDAPGGFAPGGTGWIFTTAWGPAGTWPDHAPDTHLNQRPERFPLYIEQGNLGNGSDGSVLVRWAQTFATEAQQAGWPTTYHEQSGADHFSIRWDASGITRGDMDAIWSAA